MNTDNYLDIISSKGDTFIYRIIQISRLFELFKSNLNVLVKPYKWEDPFENFVLRSELIYGQCWTLQTASDAMWRIYSPNSDAVRIRTNVHNLFNGLYQSPDKSAQDEVFIGRVQYLRSSELIIFAKSIIEKFMTASAKTLAQTLLVKRPAFKHEREIRLLYIPFDKNQATADFFKYQVDPNTLIDQIMIDPRVSEENAYLLKREIRKKTSFKGEILRSLLYAPPPDFSKEVQKARYPS